MDLAELDACIMLNFFAFSMLFNKVAHDNVMHSDNNGTNIDKKH